MRNPDTLTTQYNLALLLRDMGRYREAEATVRQTLALRREVLGDKHPSVGSALSVLGGCLTLLGRFDEAESALNESINVLTEKYGNRLDVLVVVDNG